MCSPRFSGDVCVCANVCVYTCVRVCICICVCTYICIYTYIYIFLSLLFLIFLIQIPSNPGQADTPPGRRTATRSSPPPHQPPTSQQRADYTITTLSPTFDNTPIDNPGGHSFVTNLTLKDYSIGSLISSSSYLALLRHMPQDKHTGIPMRNLFPLHGVWRTDASNAVLFI